MFSLFWLFWCTQKWINFFFSLEIYSDVAFLSYWLIHDIACCFSLQSICIVGLTNESATNAIIWCRSDFPIVYWSCIPCSGVFHLFFSCFFEFTFKFCYGKQCRPFHLQKKLHIKMMANRICRFYNEKRWQWRLFICKGWGGTELFVRALEA